MVKFYLAFLLAYLLISPVDSLNQETFSFPNQDAAIEHQTTTLSLLSFNIWNEIFHQFPAVKKKTLLLRIVPAPGTASADA
jgi:hypothetical protein